MDKVHTEAKPTPQGDTTVPAKADELELVALLASLRIEAAPEAHFEERFLYDFHERIAREAVCRPARTLLWEHVSQFAVNLLRRRRFAFGATACGAFALCSAYFAWSPGEYTEKHAEATLTNRFESTLSSLKPGVAKDMTRISVGKPSTARAAATSPTTLRTPVLFAEADDSYESSAYSRNHQQETMPLQQTESVGMPSIGL